MPPTRYSRYRFCSARQDSAGKRFLEPRDPFPFRDDPRNRTYIVRSGDTPHTIAANAFHGAFDSPQDLYWVILDYQPSPVHDPTVTIEPGTELVIPSPALVREELFSERRR